MSTPTNPGILFPVGRLVQGDLYKAQDKDDDGNPLLVKSGPNKGQATVRFFFAVAIRKDPGEQHFAQTPWGQQVYQIGAAAFPQAYQNPAFAWKVMDGDSTIPNKKGKKPCDNENFRGHWVVRFSSGFAPKIYNADGSQPITDTGAVKPGYFVQVFATVAGNGNTTSPGVYVNHSMVALAAYGPEIVYGPDATAVGFGQGTQLPPGASAVPLGGMMAPPQAAGALMLPPVPGVAPGLAMLPPLPSLPLPGAPAMGMPAAPQQFAPPPAMQLPPAYTGAMGMPAAPQQFAPPPAMPMPQMPMPPAPVAGPQMTAAAGGHGYAALIAAGWTDAALRTAGMML